MSDEPSTRTFDPDDRLHEAIASFEMACDAGGQPDPKEWLEKYPEVASALAGFFADQKHLGLFALPAASAPWDGFENRPTSWSEHRPSIPDY
jgi:hypothetical protein